MDALPEFALVRAATLEEVIGARARHPDSRLLGGGTDLVVNIRRGIIAPPVLIDINRVAELRAIRADARSLEIGAAVNIAEVAAHQEVMRHYPVVAQAAEFIAGPTHRNMGTVGGNLFAPSPYGDFTVALLALDATVSVQGGLGARDMPIEEFLQSRERQSGALVLAVSCQRPASTEAFRYRKIARIKPKGGSVITLAAHLPARGGRISGARIALGSMAATQIRARAAERALEGRALDDAAISAAAAAATEGVSPADNALGSAWYRREIVGVHLRRLLSGLE